MVVDPEVSPLETGSSCSPTRACREMAWREEFTHTIHAHVYIHVHVCVQFTHTCIKKSYTEQSRGICPQQTSETQAALKST